MPHDYRSLTRTGLYGSIDHVFSICEHKTI
jgi:hypothetical protein